MTADNLVRVLHVRGDHYQLGFQHGQQARDLRPFIAQAMEARFSQLKTDGVDDQFEALLAETETLLHTIDPATVEMVRGIAAGLSLSFEQLLRYNLIPFLRDALTTRRVVTSDAPAEGCTTWAASGVATRSGQPILVKNRDYHLDNSPLQVVIEAEPVQGYRYTYVTSAGSPGVFVAGFNEAGLALVDTHVPTPDVGPGLPTYALSMHILEEQRTVRAALDYLQTTARLGRNNLLLADAGGDIALVEMSHRHVAVLEAEAGLLVNTNHYNSPLMRPYFVETDPEPLRGNTFGRYATVKSALAGAMGDIDLSLAQWLMAQHGGPQVSICRHPVPGAESSTISTMIFLPARKEMHFCLGRPCTGQYRLFSL